MTQYSFKYMRESILFCDVTCSDLDLWSICWFLVFKWRFMVLPTSNDFLSQIRPQWDKKFVKSHLKFYAIIISQDMLKHAKSVYHKNKWQDLWREIITYFFLRGENRTFLLAQRNRKKIVRFSVLNSKQRLYDYKINTVIDTRQSQWLL